MLIPYISQKALNEIGTTRTLLGTPNLPFALLYAYGRQIAPKGCQDIPE